ncbi:MAG: metal-dependent hydrolase [Azospirillaceae bacterium]
MDITYFGHSTFRIRTGSSVILVDPFLSRNPWFKGDLDEAAEGLTHIAITHGHGDHVGDAIELAKTHDATVIATFELAAWIGTKGVDKTARCNTGGKQVFDDFSITLTQAFHSSSFTEENGQIVYLGMPNGLVFDFPDGPSVYHMGDTEIFGDMALINELHKPAIGLVPMGDRFTMGARSAALACKRYFSFDMVVPIHWGTMPILAPSPDDFIESMGNKAGIVRTPEMGTAFVP